MLVALLGVSAVATADTGQVALVSKGTTSGGCGLTLCGSTFIGASPDGSKVFFLTDEQLTADDGDDVLDIYERSNGATELVSTAPGQVSGVYGVLGAKVSPDGNHVFFETDDQLVPEDLDNNLDVYERTGDIVTLISTGASFNGAFDASFAGASADGTHVFFTTLEPIGDGDTDDAPDIYEFFGNTTSRVTKGDSAAGNGDADPVFAGASKDGTHVFFTTTEALATDDTDASRADVYERYQGHTKLMSRTTGTTGALNGAFDAAFAGATPDGVNVFVQTKEKLATSDTDASQDVFRRAGGTTVQVSTGPTNPNGAFDISFDGSSDDGNRVFFETTGKLTSDDTDTRLDIYERQVTAATTKVVSTGPTSNGAAAVTPIFLQASPDGTRVYFAADDAFTADDTDTGKDIFVRSGTATTLISGGFGPNNLDVCLPPACAFKATADGSRVFFQTVEGLVATDVDGQLDVYQRMNGVTDLISAGDGLFEALLAGVSADGLHVYFVTEESLIDPDNDGVRDVYEAAAPGVVIPPDQQPVKLDDPVPSRPAAPASPSAPAPRSVKARVTGNGTQHVLRNGAVTVRIRCDIACGATASATVGIPGASKALSLRRATGKVDAGARRMLKLRLSSKAKRVLRHSLRRSKRLRATITVTVRGNAGGPAETLKLPVRLIR